MPYFYRDLVQWYSGIESTVGTAPASAFLDYMTSCKTKVVRQTSSPAEYVGISNGVTDESELNHYMQHTLDLYLRYQGFGMNSLAAILAGGDTKTGSSSPFTHGLKLANTTNFVKSQHAWYNDASGVLQELPAGTVESWKLDWNTEQDNAKIEIILDTFMALNQSSANIGGGSYTALPGSIVPVSSVNGGRVSKAVQAQYKIYNGAQSAYTSYPISGSLTLTRATKPFFGQNMNSAGTSPVDPYNAVAFVSDALAVSGQFVIVFDGNATGTPYDDFKFFKELAGANYASHRIIFNDPSGLYSLEFDLGPMKWGDVEPDPTQNPIQLTLPFTVYSSSDLAAGNGSATLATAGVNAVSIGASPSPTITYGSNLAVPASLTVGATVSFSGGTVSAGGSGLTVSSVVGNAVTLSGSVTYSAAPTGMQWTGGTQSNNICSAILISPLSSAIF